MRRAPGPGDGRRRADEERPFIPVRATAVVLSVWVVVLLVLAFGVVPLLFATCAAG
ncbi:MAG: hypothetical protein M3O91_10785 [Chloroflexota bacterium]|nr:hypothetical protein [Chloroflexota bacterium]